MYALSAGAKSIWTLVQSASSSSASSIGKEVATPWPISQRSTMTSTLSSGPMRSHALGAKGAGPCSPRVGMRKPMTRPAPTVPAVWRNARRSMSGLLCRAVHGGADALVGATAADVGHGLIDLLVAGVGGLGERRGRRHDLARLTVAALRHVLHLPRFLHAVARGGCRGRQTFDRRDLGGADGGDREDAGAGRFAVQVD